MARHRFPTNLALARPRRAQLFDPLGRWVVVLAVVVAVVVAVVGKPNGFNLSACANNS